MQGLSWAKLMALKNTEKNVCLLIRERERQTDMNYDSSMLGTSLGM